MPSPTNCWQNSGSAHLLLRRVHAALAFGASKAIGSAGPSRIDRRRGMRRLIVVLLAGMAVLGVAGAAWGAGKISGKQIKTGTITGKQVKNRSLTRKDFRGS